MRDETKTKAELVTELRAIRKILAEQSSRLEGHLGPSDPRDPNSLHQSVLETLRALLIERDQEGRLTYVSSSVTEILGYQAEEVLGNVVADWMHPDDHDLIAKHYQGQSPVLSMKHYSRIRHKLGHWVPVEGTVSGYRDGKGQMRSVAILRDVTELQRAGEALRESEDRYRTMAENATDLITELGADGQFLFVTPNLESLLGYPADALVGKQVGPELLARSVHPDDRERVMARFQDVRGASDAEYQMEFRCRHADGSWRTMESKGRAYRASDGALHLIAISRDVTERVLAEEQLRHSEERYRVVSEASRDLISELDAEGRLLYISSRNGEALGYTEEELYRINAEGGSFFLIHPDDVERIWGQYQRSLETRTPMEMSEYRLRHKDGHYLWLVGRGIPYEREDGSLSMMAVSRDISDRVHEAQERQRLEVRVQQAQRLEGLGIMAGGIAHDFNNLLTPILGQSSLALADLPADSPARPKLEAIQRAAKRAAGLTKQMLAYAGTDPISTEVLNLSTLARELGELLKTNAPGGTTLHFDLAADLPLVDADASQLTQVVMNLISNAFESVDDGDLGVTIHTGTMLGAESDSSNLVYGDLDPETVYVYFEVSDSGSGMADETRMRIFDPFFTTKFTGRGLGLAAVLGIVRGHAGAIQLESVLGEGTRFRVLLPAAVQPAAGGTQKAPAAAEVPWSAEGTVLVVDDDAAVTEMILDVLTRVGLSVLVASDGEQAMERFRDNADSLRLVLLDRTMPSVRVGDLLHKMQELRGEIPVVMMSGYSHARVAEDAGSRDIAGFVSKPFLPEVLLEKLRAVLSA